MSNNPAARTTDMPRVARIRVESSAAHESAMLDAVRAGHLARGPHLEAFGRQLTNLFAKRFVVLTANGFGALFLALRARGLPLGTRVQTAAAGTCFAMVNAIRAVGLEPDFVDLEPDSLGLVSINGPQDDNPRAAIAPDHFGRISVSLRKYRRSPGHFVVEDAAQAFASRRAIATQADAVVLSFYPTKWGGGIDGGAVLTDDQSLFDEMTCLVNYMNQGAAELTPRYNLSMPNLHATYALVSLQDADRVSDRLLHAHAVLARVAAECGLVPLPVGVREVPTRCLLVAPSAGERDRLMQELAGHRIEASRELLFLCPPADMHRFPEAARLVERTLALPFHPYLRPEELERMAAAIHHCAARR